MRNIYSSVVEFLLLNLSVMGSNLLLLHDFFHISGSVLEKIFYFLFFHEDSDDHFGSWLGGLDHGINQFFCFLDIVYYILNYTQHKSLLNVI